MADLKKFKVGDYLDPYQGKAYKFSKEVFEFLKEFGYKATCLGDSFVFKGYSFQLDDDPQQQKPFNKLKLIDLYDIHMIRYVITLNDKPYIETISGQLKGLIWEYFNYALENVAKTETEKEEVKKDMFFFDLLIYHFEKRMDNELLKEIKAGKTSLKSDYWPNYGEYKTSKSSTFGCELGDVWAEKTGRREGAFTPNRYEKHNNRRTEWVCVSNLDHIVLYEGAKDYEEARNIYIERNRT